MGLWRTATVVIMLVQATRVSAVIAIRVAALWYFSLGQFDDRRKGKSIWCLVHIPSSNHAG
jgi:hypothetical protein